MNRRNRAFTLIEIIIVISIILILMGMVILGIRKVNESARSNTSKVMMENGRSMLAEYNRAAAALPLPSQPLDLSVAAGYYPADLATENPDNIDSSTVPPSARPYGRYGRAMVYSRAVMGRLMQSPAVRKMVEAMPADRMLQIPEGLNLTPGIALYPVAPPPGPVSLMAYTIGQELAPGTTTAPYICFAAFTDSSAFPYPDARPRQGVLSQWHWLEITNSSSALVDGFGNPLLFMPACGFLANGNLVTSGGTFAIAGSVYWNIGQVYVAGNYAVYTADGRSYQLYRCSAANTATALNAPGQSGAPWIRVATTPFFASAGPDGIFFDPARPETLNDNVYSFEN